MKLIGFERRIEGVSHIFDARLVDSWSVKGAAPRIAEPCLEVEFGLPVSADSVVSTVAGEMSGRKRFSLV